MADLRSSIRVSMTVRASCSCRPTSLRASGSRAFRPRLASARGDFFPATWVATVRISSVETAAAMAAARPPPPGADVRGDAHVGGESMPGIQGPDPRLWWEALGPGARTLVSGGGATSSSTLAPSGTRSASRPAARTGGPALAQRLEAQHGRRHAHVQRFGLSDHRDRHAGIELPTPPRNPAPRPRFRTPAATFCVQSNEE